MNFDTKKVDSIRSWGPDSEVEIKKGDRIEYDNPCGIGGVTLNATVAGFTVHADGMIGVVGIDAEPNDRLREIVAQLKKEATKYLRLSGAPLRPFGPIPPQRNGLDGNGGPILVTGKAFAMALMHGQIRLRGDE